MQKYIVGGAVRDKLLNIDSRDKDYLLIANESEINLNEYKKVQVLNQTVYLNDGIEYVLSDSLENDLSRRDFTINAMAMDIQENNIYDPFNGIQDLKNKVIRAVNDNVFIEDPIRILRAARFAARYEFIIEPNTFDLMRKITNYSEIKPERIFLELEKGMIQGNFSTMIEILHEAGCLKQILPELDKLWGIPQPEKYHPEIDTGIHILMVLQQANALTPQEQFACLLHDLGKGLTPPNMYPKHWGHEESGILLVENICKRLKIPNDYKSLALLVCAEHGNIHNAFELSPQKLLKILKKSDALRKPERFEQLLNCCEADKTGRLGKTFDDYPQKEYLNNLNQFMMENKDKIADVAQKYSNNKDLMLAKIHEQQISLIKQYIRQQNKLKSTLSIKKQ